MAKTESSSLSHQDVNKVRVWWLIPRQVSSGSRAQLWLIPNKHILGGTTFTKEGSVPKIKLLWSNHYKQTNKNPVNFLSSQVNSSGVSTSLSAKLPSRKRLKKGSSTFSLEIFLLWWGVTLLHDMKESEASEPVLKGGGKKILLWTQSCCNDTSAHFSAFPSMAILPTPLFSSAHSLALLHGVGIVPAMLCLQQLWWMKDPDTQPLSCIWDRLQLSGQIRFLFWIPISISRHRETWAAFTQIWYPALSEKRDAEGSWTA